MIGQTISHYRILAKLGEGGMGVVYRASDLTLGREVALKLLPAHVAADHPARLRLLKEAQNASRLNHPNIAVVYEVNSAENIPFIAMELVPGETLKESLRAGPLAAPQLLKVCRQIAEGMWEAHRHGVYHRDIKPANVMMDSRACVKILDFGLSRFDQHEPNPSETAETFATRISNENTTGGTVPYMSPEQLRGEPADARSDIFSFGVLIYECLTGRLPFSGETSIDVMHAILRAPHTPLRSLLPQISPAWETLVDQCLAKSREQRYASMDAIVETLRSLEAPSQQPEKSIAVLYFSNLNGDKDDEYFRDGMTEDIITELTKIEELRLLPRSAVLPFRDKPLPVNQIGRQLAAAYVLDGSLRRAGSRLRITAQLADTRTGHSVWAERYDRQLEDVFAIQDDIAQSIARALRVMLSDREKRAIEKVPTRDVQAYDYYLRGRRIFYEMKRKSFEYARQMFARAIVIDPSYAAAYAGVADSSSFLYMWIDATEDNLREAINASRRAVDLDPESAEAHVSRGLANSLSRNYQEAEKEFEAAIRLNPKLYDGYYLYARCCFAKGDKEMAAALFRKASELDPEDYQSLNHLEMCLRSLGRPAEAQQACKAALAAAERRIAVDPTDTRALYLGAGACQLLGERTRALDLAARALAMDPEESSILYNVACTYALLGESERALDLLETAVNNGFGHKEWIENDPDFVSLRELPRFQSLMSRLSAKTSRQGL